MHDSAVTVIPPGRGEVVGDSPDRRVEILSDHEALAVTWSRFSPGRAGADLHVHRRHVDLFYVLEGELTVMFGAGGEETTVPAGTLVRVPPLVVHGFRNASDAELRYLNFHAPGMGFADYLRGARDGRAIGYDQEPPPDGGRPATEAELGGERGAARDGVQVLVDVEEIAVAECRIDHGSPPPPVRPRDGRRQAFYVLEGELVLGAGDRELRAVAGSWIELPPGVAPSVASPGPSAARFLHLHAPAGGSDRRPLSQ